MPARDAHHNAVRNALIKEGWLITDDPFVIVFKGLRLYADLGAERVIAAERGTHRIVEDIYQDFFLRDAVQDIVSDHAISLLIFKTVAEEIVQWIN